MWHKGSPMTTSLKRLLALCFGLVGWICVATDGRSAPMPGDERWDFRFGRVGLDNSPTAFAWHDEQLHLGGWFYSAGHAVANGIARWDGTNFWPLGGGLSTPRDFYAAAPNLVTTVASFRGRLFAGGQFSFTDTNATHGLAVWDGTNWNIFESVTGRVGVLRVVNDALYVGGVLGFPGDTNRYAVARWDGAQWETFGSVVKACFHCGEASVHALAVSGEEIILLGSFNYLAGLPIGGHARFDGQEWKQFPLNVSGSLRDVAFHGGELFVAGQFFAISDNVTSDSVTNVARWTGTNWTAVGEHLGIATWPLEGVDDDSVDGLHSAGNVLYAIGDFARSGSSPMDGVARWNGGAWEALGTNIMAVNDRRAAIGTSPDGRIFIGGYFESLRGRPTGHIAEWDGVHWQPLGPDTARGVGESIGFVFSLATHGPDVYAGGIFRSAGTVRSGALARLTPAGATNVGIGFTNFSDRVLALTVMGTNLFAGGRFTNAGGVAVNHLARWDGAAWSGFGNAVQSNVLALATDGARLFVGGLFTEEQGSVGNCIAVWDGTNWASLGRGMNNAVAALAWADGFLYAGGAFTNAGGTEANRVARWNGSAWEALGDGIGGTNSRVNALVVSGSNVFAAGQRFAMAGSRTVTNIAHWNGADWQPLGNIECNGVNNTVFALAMINSDLFVGGNFTMAGSVAARGLARWDGTNWSSLGSGVDYAQSISTSLPRVLALLPHGNDLYLGGAFTSAGGYPAYGIARWVDQPRIRFNSIEHAPTGTDIWLSGLAGLRYALEASADLQNWSCIDSSLAFTPTQAIAVPATATNSAVFFRAVLNP